MMVALNLFWLVWTRRIVVVEGLYLLMSKKIWRYDYLNCCESDSLTYKEMYLKFAKEVPVGEAPAPEQDPVMAVEMDVEQHSGKDWFKR
jgi:hypothetical protein